MKKQYRIKSKFRFTLFLTVAILFVVGITSTAIGANTAESLTKPVYSEITVACGDTLWNLAEKYGPSDKDVREVVYQICKVNHVSADDIYPGQTILIPKFI